MVEEMHWEIWHCICKVQGKNTVSTKMDVNDPFFCLFGGFFPKNGFLLFNEKVMRKTWFGLKDTHYVLLVRKHIKCLHSVKEPKYLLKPWCINIPAGCVCLKAEVCVSEASGGVRPSVSRGTEEHKDWGWMVRIQLSRGTPDQRST